MQKNYPENEVISAGLPQQIAKITEALNKITRSPGITLRENSDNLPGWNL